MDEPPRNTDRAADGHHARAADGHHARAADMHGAHEAGGPDGEVASPRFWGPASWWRLGIAAFAVLILVLLLMGR